jgi:WD40 repeat protein
MGCGASNEAQANGNAKDGRGKGRHAKSRRERNPLNTDDVSEASSPSNAHHFDDTVVPCRVPDDDQASQLSEISETDLGGIAHLSRATTTVAPFGAKGLDQERAEAEVDYDAEYFVWDDASLDLRDMKAKQNARKNMAAARNKVILSQRPVDKPAVTGAFVFNDFTIEDAATLDALSESTRNPHPHVSAKRESIRRPVPATPKRPPGDIKAFSVTTRIGHSSRVKCLAVAPGEREYVSCSNDDTIVTYYDVRTSQELGIFSGHQDTVIHAVFSPCGKFLATTSRDNTLMLWDVVTQKAVLTFEHGKVVICCAFSKTSRFIATGCQDKVCRLWECRRGRELVAFAQHDGIIISLSISPDETYVVSASADKTLRIWTVAKGKVKAILRGHSHIILACNYNVDGTKIVSNDERSVRLWSAPAGTQLRCIMVDDLVKVRNLPANKKQSWTLSCMAPKSFPRHFVVASNNRMVFVIDMETGTEALSVDTKAPVYCLAPGHRNVVAYGDSFGNVYFLKLDTFDEEEPTNDRPGGADWA